MIRKTLLVLGLALPALVVQQAGLAADLPPASKWVPEEAALVAEVTEPAALLGPLLDADVAKALTAASSNQPPNLKLLQLQGVVAYLELQLNTNWRTGVRKLLGQGVTFALGPGGETLLCADGEDEKMLQLLHDTVQHFAAAEAAKQQHPERVASKEYQGATAWTLAPNEAHALLGTRLLLANRPDILSRALDLRADPKGKSIAASPLYQAALQAVGTDAVARVFINLKTVGQAPQVKAALAGNDNPMGTLLLADTKEALRAGSWLALGLYVLDGKLVIKAFTDGQAPSTAKTAAFSTPQETGDGLPPNLTVPGRIAGLSLYRDLRAFYAAKDELFPERTSGLVFFENMMGIFFSGTELTDGVLGQTRPGLRVVVAGQHYDPAIGTPKSQVPAFAVVLRLRDPEKFSGAVEEAWQKAVGLINFTRGQQALPGLIIDRATHAGVKFTYCYYRPDDKEKDKTAIDDRFNYRPALAMAGDCVILSSTDGLAMDLIDAAKREAAAKPGPAAAQGVLEFDGVELHSVLLANRETLIRKNMVDKGNSREQAEADIRGLLTIVDCIDEGTLTLTRNNGRPQATLEIKPKLPSGEPVGAANSKPAASPPKS